MLLLALLFKEPNDVRMCSQGITSSSPPPPPQCRCGSALSRVLGYMHGPQSAGLCFASVANPHWHAAIPENIDNHLQ